MGDTGTVVRLPDGSYVTVHDTPQEWWGKNQHTGYVHPSLLAPDPDQPRKKIASAPLAELRLAISAAGVREPITVTPLSKAQWITVDEDHKKCPLVVVSGHRRLKCAREVGLTAVPIRIVIYPNETVHRNDAAALNTNREAMSPMDEARDINRRLKLGEKPRTIARSYGKNNEIWVYGRNSLNNLAPEFQLLLDPELAKNDQLPLTVAIALGTVRKATVNSIKDYCTEHDLDMPKVYHSSEEELAHTLQKLMYQVIKQQNMSAAVAVSFIEGSRRSTGSGAYSTSYKSQKHKASKRIEVLTNWLKGVTNGVPPTWPSADLNNIFAGQTYEATNALLAASGEALVILARITKELETIMRQKPKSNAGTAALLTTPVKPVQLFTPSKRSMADMTPEEAAAIAARYGAKVSTRT